MGRKNNKQKKLKKLNAKTLTRSQSENILVGNEVTSIDDLDDITTNPSVSSGSLVKSMEKHYTSSVEDLSDKTNSEGLSTSFSSLTVEVPKKNKKRIMDPEWAQRAKERITAEALMKRFKDAAAKGAEINRKTMIFENANLPGPSSEPPEENPKQPMPPLSKKTFKHFDPAVELEKHLHKIAPKLISSSTLRDALHQLACLVHRTGRNDLISKQFQTLSTKDQANDDLVMVYGLMQYWADMSFDVEIPETTRSTSSSVSSFVSCESAAESHQATAGTSSDERRVLECEVDSLNDVGDEFETLSEIQFDPPLVGSFSSSEPDLEEDLNVSQSPVEEGDGNF